LVTRLAALEAEQRRETQWHTSSANFSCRKTRTVHQLQAIAKLAKIKLIAVLLARGCLCLAHDDVSVVGGELLGDDARFFEQLHER
jgi:hypothetical protein